MAHLGAEEAHRFVRGNGTAEELRAWADHVATCVACADLVAQERSWSAILRLDKLEPQPSPDPSRILPKIEALVPAVARRRRGRDRVLLAASAACLVTTIAAVYAQLTIVPEETALANETGIDVPTQRRIVANLDALQALRRDPWLAERQRTVDMLAAILQDYAEPNP